MKAYSDLFDRMDLDNNGFLNKQELDNYSMQVEGAPLQESSYKWLLGAFESRNAPGLTKRAFIQAQEYVFQHTGADQEKLRAGFRTLGYDAKYVPCNSYRNCSLQYSIQNFSCVVVHFVPLVIVLFPVY